MFFQAIAWAPVGSVLARCLFTTVLAWAPAGLLVGSCVFLGFELDSKLALFGLLCQICLFTIVSAWAPGLLVGSLWAPVFFHNFNLIACFLSRALLDPAHVNFIIYIFWERAPNVGPLRALLFL